MVNENIIRMAREAGAFTELSETPEKDVVFLKRFAKLVRDDYSNKHAKLWLKRVDEAYAAGQRDMRERAAGMFDDVADVRSDISATAIRALPIEGDQP